MVIPLSMASKEELCQKAKKDLRFFLRSRSFDGYRRRGREIVARREDLSNAHDRAEGKSYK